MRGGGDGPDSVQLLGGLRVGALAAPLFARDATVRIAFPHSFEFSLCFLRGQQRRLRFARRMLDCSRLGRVRVRGGPVRPRIPYMCQNRSLLSK